MMEEVTLPIEVRVVLHDRTVEGTGELLKLLQEIADEWYWQRIPTIPCSTL
jgi:hypothetical protein